MRIFLILFFICCTINSQEIDSVLIPYFNEYMVDAKKHNVDVIKKINKLKYITFKDMHSGWLGRFTRNSIYINSKYGYTGKYVRLTLYHELGHVMGLKHVCSNCFYIMSSEVGNIDYLTMSDEEWEEYKTAYFNQIKNKNNLINTKIIKNGTHNRKTRKTKRTQFRFK